MNTVRRPSDRDLTVAHPVQFKVPYDNSKWLLVGPHSATRNLQYTPAWHVRDGVWQYIEIDRIERKWDFTNHVMMYKHMKRIDSCPMFIEMF